MIRVKQTPQVDNTILYQVQKYMHNPFTCGFKLIYMTVLNKTFYICFIIAFNIKLSFRQKIYINLSENFIKYIYYNHFYFE